MTTPVVCNRCTCRTPREASIHFCQPLRHLWHFADVPARPHMNSQYSLWQNRFPYATRYGDTMGTVTHFSRFLIRFSRSHNLPLLTVSRSPASHGLAFTHFSRSRGHPLLTVSRSPASHGQYVSSLSNSLSKGQMSQMCPETRRPQQQLLPQKPSSRPTAACRASNVVTIIKNLWMSTQCMHLLAPSHGPFSALYGNHAPVADPQVSLNHGRTTSVLLAWYRRTAGLVYAYCWLRCKQASQQNEQKVFQRLLMLLIFQHLLMLLIFQRFPRRSLARNPH